MTVRFLHVADLHLGLRITRFDEKACERIGEARFEAIDRLRDLAVEHRVDFMLVAGDVFDDANVSRKISDRCFRLFEGSKVPCPIFIIPGNHDPLTPGGVWDRDPWLRDQPVKNVRVLREAKPVALPTLPVTLFPCPLRHRNSVDDPTRWIADHPRQAVDGTIRIGLAHGSLNILPNLPGDDHLIRPDAAVFYGLDYLALGHWHRELRHTSSDGACRAAYCGTHEPMRFPSADTLAPTGWSSYSADGDADRFTDGGRGNALLVTIDEANAPPKIETLETGQLRWSMEERDVALHPLGELISDYSQRSNRNLTVLRLKLKGVLDVRQIAQVDDVLREIICNRYCPGSSLEADGILFEPRLDQLREMVGDGVLSRVLERLQVERQSLDGRERHVAEQALKLLYRTAWEGQQA